MQQERGNIMTTLTDGDEYVYRAFKLLVRGLRPFVERQFEAYYGAAWQIKLDDTVREYVPWQKSEPNVVLDAQSLLVVMARVWFPVFGGVFGKRAQETRSYTHQLLATRHRLAHWAPDHDFSRIEVESMLISSSLLLTAINSSQADGVEQLRDQLAITRGKPIDKPGVEITSIDPIDSIPDDTQTELVLRSRYTPPGDAKVVMFMDLQEGDVYLQWVEDHAANGFVINAPRQPSLFEKKLHKASCGAIKGTGKNLVGNDTFKVCSEDKDALVNWVQVQPQPGKWSFCGLCKP